MYRSAMPDCSAFITHNVLLTPHYLPHTLSPSPPTGGGPSGPQPAGRWKGGRGL
jgi:hypothetical protein